MISKLIWVFKIKNQVEHFKIELRVQLYLFPLKVQSKPKNDLQIIRKFRIEFCNIVNKLKLVYHKSFMMQL